MNLIKDIHKDLEKKKLQEAADGGDVMAGAELEATKALEETFYTHKDISDSEMKIFVDLMNMHIRDGDADDAVTAAHLITMDRKFRHLGKKDLEDLSDRMVALYNKGHQKRAVNEEYDTDLTVADVKELATYINDMLVKAGTDKDTVAVDEHIMDALDDIPGLEMEHDAQKAHDQIRAYYDKHFM